jgi:tRNA nucleotidyltransferase (CCA-adding enzyme)
VVQTLGANKPGPWTGQVLAKVVEWQLGHPDGSKEDCKFWLKDELKAGKIAVDECDGSKRGTSGTDGNGRGGKKAKR